MHPLTIKATDKELMAGEFGAEIIESELRLPQELVNLFSDYGIRDITEFLSYADSFPASVASDLFWTMSDLQKGLETLKQLLPGYVHREFLNPKPRQNRAPGVPQRSTWKNTAR